MAGDGSDVHSILAPVDISMPSFGVDIAKNLLQIQNGPEWVKMYSFIDIAINSA